MKQTTLLGAEGKALEYLGAVYRFFKGIPEIVSIDDVYFIRSTPQRVYFFVGEIKHDSNSHNYIASVFVRKKDLHVEFCDANTGEIITPKYLKLFKETSIKENNAWD